jgi:TatD DNase family protein
MNRLRHDAHFHLDLYKNIPEIIEEIEKRQIYTIAVTNLPVLYVKLNQRLQSKYIRVGLGFHPELIAEYQKYIPQMWKYLEDARYIGEVGLDLKDKSKSNAGKQIQFFKELIHRCNTLGGKILSLHSRGSEKELLSIIGSDFNGYLILHWYSGTLKLLDEAINTGFYFSVNFAMLQSVKGKKIVERIPVDRILIESDGPFVKVNKKIHRPRDLESTVKGLAKLKNIDSLSIDKILSQNFKRILM